MAISRDINEDSRRFRGGEGVPSPEICVVGGLFGQSGIKEPDETAMPKSTNDLHGKF
jgi:hypothetical protein